MAKNSKRKEKKVCPVCGQNRVLTLHHILPRYIMREINKSYFEYSYFLNGSNSYRLCRDCHSKYETASTEFRKNLFRENDIPENAMQKYIVDKDTHKVKYLCRFIVGKINFNMYKLTKWQAYNFVRKYLKKRILFYGKIRKIANEKRTKIENPSFINVGKKLIENMKLETLDKIYRQNFIEFLKSHNAKYIIKESNRHYEK